MWIKALCDYYEANRDRFENTEHPEGYVRQKVDYRVILRENGELASVLPVSKDDPGVWLPERANRTSGVISALIEANPEYLFGMVLDKGTITVTEHSVKCHQAFREKNEPFFRGLSSPVCKAFYRFIADWNPQEQTENEVLLSSVKSIKKGSQFCFELNESNLSAPQDDDEFITAYSLSRMSESGEEDASMAVCPILGECLPVARIHDSIKYPGGAAKTTYVGVNEESGKSYGKEQGYNSGISIAAMKRYTAAFNDLLGDPRHRRKLDDLTILFFAVKRDDSKEADFFQELFDVSEKGDEQTMFSDAIASLLRGEPVDYSALDIDESADFYLGGFTVNTARICQKFLIHNSFGKIMENVARFQRDLALSENPKPVRFWQLTRELISPKAKNATVPPPLLAAISRSIFEGTPYPTALLQTAVLRVKTDSDEEKKHYIKMNDIRVGIIKACLNRKTRILYNKEEITVALNEENKTPAYLCGRLFAVLEKIQMDASGGTLNSTILDRYFSSACTRPASVFPRLVELSVHHLKKTGDAAQVYYQKLIGEIVDPLDGGFPATLSLDDQGRFIVGYYQQKKIFYTKKEEEN